MHYTLHTIHNTWLEWLPLQILDAPPPHKRRMPLWKVGDGYTDACTVKELFERVRIKSFSSDVHTLFSRILRGENKRCQPYTQPSSNLFNPSIPEAVHYSPATPLTAQVEMGHRRRRKNPAAKGT